MPSDPRLALSRASIIVFGTPNQGSAGGQHGAKGFVAHDIQITL